jgi:hypothetical protein
LKKVCILFLCVVSNLCLAQNYCKYNKPGKKIRSEDFGIFITAHGTEISAPNNIFPKSRNGTILNGGFGISFKRRIKRNDFLKVELSFIQKGSFYSFNQSNYRTTIRLNYLEFPFLWSHGFYSRKKTFFIETGLAFSQLILSSRQINIYAGQSPDPNAQNFKNIDIPWITSIKAPLNSKGKNNLEIGFRFSYSPLSIHRTYKTQSIAMFKDDGMHNMTYGIQLEYKFN